MDMREHHLRGGWRQRLNEEQLGRPRSRSRSRSPKGTVCRGERRASKLAGSLLMDWAWGSVSAPSVQKHARNAVSDGASLPILKRLGRMGGGGTSPNAVQAQLMRMFHKRLSGRLLCDVPDSSVSVMIPPHVAFSALFHENRAKFKIRFGADRQALRIFWDQL
jgi:hypothetical protein